ILFIGEFNDFFFDILKNRLEIVFDSFFYNIFNLGEFSFSQEIFYSGIKEEYNQLVHPPKLTQLHPTKKFYDILLKISKKLNIQMVLALTNLPIYSSYEKNLIFPFGEAHLKFNCCIVSTLNLEKERSNMSCLNSLFLKRIQKETIHEIGHLLLGYEHCAESECAMRFSKNLKEIDQKSFILCQKCNLKLKILRNRYNF
ncbi:MAG: hypothetical protein ACFFAO_10675, partial [Candidatus Hermodarchaeota archaeon]